MGSRLASSWYVMSLIVAMLPMLVPTSSDSSDSGTKYSWGTIT